MKIIPLKEGNFAVSKNKEFELLNPDSDSRKLRMATQPFLVITQTEHILLDAGQGWLNNEKTVVLDLLEKENISPDQISHILLSHLHKDHIDGLFKLTGDGYEANYPNAKIYVQKREYEFALEKKDNPSFNVEILELLPELPNIIWMEGNDGEITEGVSYEVTGGHTPYHQSFWIKENDETVFYGADNLPQRGYLDYDIAYKTDHDGKKGMELRRAWEKQAKAEQWKILLYHDMKVPILTL